MAPGGDNAGERARAYFMRRDPAAADDTQALLRLALHGKVFMMKDFEVHIDRAIERRKNPLTSEFDGSAGGRSGPGNGGNLY